MPKKCPSGKIIRVSYTRKDGVHIKETCIKDLGKPGKTKPSEKILPIPKQGGLGQYGYKNVLNTSAKIRRSSLETAVKKEGYKTIIGRLVLISNYNKLSQPKIHDIMRKDIEWMKTVLKPKYSLTSKKPSKKSSRKPSKKSSKKPSKKSLKKLSKKPSKKLSKKPSKKLSKKLSKKPSKKSLKKLSKKPLKKLSKKPSKKSSRKKPSKKSLKKPSKK